MTKWQTFIVWKTKENWEVRVKAGSDSAALDYWESRRPPAPPGCTWDLYFPDGSIVGWVAIPIDDGLKNDWDANNPKTPKLPPIVR